MRPAAEPAGRSPAGDATAPARRRPPRPTSPAPAAATVAELLAVPGLGCTLVAGDPDRCRRQLTGAHSIELEHPTRWLDRDWVMLTTGLELAPDDLAAQRALVAELDEAGVAALGFGLGVVHPQVPAGVLEEADRRGLPVFSVQLETAFRDLVAAVYRGVWAPASGSVNRLSAMQTFLMDSLGDEDPEATVVERLASLVGATVALLDADGAVRRRAGTLPLDGLAQRLRARPDAAIVPFAGDTLEGAAYAVRAPEGGPAAWLVLASPTGRRPGALARAAAQATVPLLVALGRLQRRHRAQEEALRASAFHSLLEPGDRHEARVAAARAAACGVDVEAGAGVLAVAAGAPGGAPSPGAVAAALEAHGVAFLGAAGDDGVAGLASAPASDNALRAVCALGADVRVGVGRTVTAADDVARSLRDARIALGRCAGGGEVVRYDDLDLVTACLSELPVDRLGPKIRQWQEVLGDNPQLHETLVAFLEQELDVGRTARALHLHPNSVRYRLGRAERALGAPLRASATIVALHVVLHHDGRPAGRRIA